MRKVKWNHTLNGRFHFTVDNWKTSLVSLVFSDLPETYSAVSHRRERDQQGHPYRCLFLRVVGILVSMATLESAGNSHSWSQTVF